MKVSSRRQDLDLLRGLAVFVMIAVHCREYFLLKAEGGGFWGTFLLWFGGAPAAPTFLFLMGFVATLHAAPGWPAAWRRALELLALGYALNFARTWLAIRLGAPLPPEMAKMVWMIDILQMAAPALLILRGLRSAPSWLLLGMALFIAFVSPLTWGWWESPHPLDFIAGGGRHVYFPLLPWLVYPLLGVVAARTESFVSRWWIAGVLLMMAGVLVSPWFSGESYSYYHTSPAHMLCFSGFVILWWLVGRWIAPRVPGWLKRSTEFFSRNVTSSYVISWLVITALTVVAGRHSQNVPMLFVLIGMATLLTAAGVKIYQRLR